MTAAVAALSRMGIRPHLRRRELGLLLLVALILAVGWLSLQSFRAGRIEVGDAHLLATYLGLYW